MGLLGVPSDPNQPCRLSPGLRGPYKADSPYDKVSSASASRSAQWEQQMKQRQYESSLAEQQNRSEKKKHVFFSHHRHICVKSISSLETRCSPCLKK